MIRPPPLDRVGGPWFEPGLIETESGVLGMMQVVAAISVLWFSVVDAIYNLVMQACSMSGSWDGKRVLRTKLVHGQNWPHLAPFCFQIATAWSPQEGHYGLAHPVRSPGPSLAVTITEAT